MHSYQRIFRSLCMLGIMGQLQAQGFRAESLTMENALNPIGIDRPNPRLAWKISGECQSQRAYQILVASSRELLRSGKGDLWDSGRVESPAQQQISYAGKPLRAHQEVFWSVRIWKENGSASDWSKPSSWSMGLLQPDDWKNAQWITDPRNLEDLKANQTTNCTVLLRKPVVVKNGLKRATASICGLGLYDLKVNGTRVSEDLFTPAWSETKRTVYYDTLDLTRSLHPGQNRLDVMLAGGFYQIAPGRYSKLITPNRALVLKALVRLEYNDGQIEEIPTGTDWSVGDSPVLFSSMYGGEDEDARIQPDQGKASAAVVGPGPEGMLISSAQGSPPLKAQGELKPISSRKINDTTMVYDLGQNAALTLRLRVRGPAGSLVKIIPAELLKADGTVDRRSCSHGGTEASWNYTLSGQADGESWEPRFFYHGSRYLQVQTQAAQSGGPQPEVKDIRGEITFSDSPAAGDFECSNPLLNQIRTLIRWAQLSNLTHVISDCPHRERLGWLEQYHLHGPSLRYEWNLDRLWEKTLRDMADCQTAEGLIPDIAPEPVVFKDGFRDSPEWGSTYVIVPWQHYLWTGDDSMLRQHFEGMKRYEDYLSTKANQSLLSHGLGDWYDVGPKSPGFAQLTPISLTATAYYFQNAEIISRTAKLLGHEEDAQRYQALADKIRVAFQAKFFNPETGVYAQGSQTAQAMPLVMGLVPEDKRGVVLAALIKDIENHQYAITAGDIGHRYLLRALSEGGRDDLIFKIHTQSDRPGYAYILKKGATALTEAWNADPQSSQNHFMLGHITEWFYHDIAGIQPDETRPGFKHFILRPHPTGDLTWAKASYQSPYGLITSSWSIQEKQFTLKAQVPPNTTATLILPDGSRHEVSAGTHEVQSKMP